MNSTKPSGLRTFCKVLFQVMINLGELAMTLVGMAFFIVSFVFCLVLVQPGFSFLPEFWCNLFAVIISVIAGMIVFFIVDLLLSAIFVVLLAVLVCIKVIPEDFLDVEIG